MNCFDILIFFSCAEFVSHGFYAILILHMPSLSYKEGQRLVYMLNMQVGMMRSQRSINLQDVYLLYHLETR